MDYTFKFKEVDINVVLDALAAMPYGRVANIINDLHQQAQEQIHAAAIQSQIPVKELIKMEVVPKIK